MKNAIYAILVTTALIAIVATIAEVRDNPVRLAVTPNPDAARCACPDDRDLADCAAELDACRDVVKACDIMLKHPEWQRKEGP